MEIPLPGLHLSVMQKGLFQLAAIGNANEVVNLLQTGQTVLELLKILLFGKTPLHRGLPRHSGSERFVRCMYRRQPYP